MYLVRPNIGKPLYIFMMFSCLVVFNSANAINIIDELLSIYRIRAKLMNSFFIVNVSHNISVLRLFRNEI